MPSKKKKYNSRFPPARIKKIMQTDDDIGKVAAAVPVLISKCLEMFLTSILTSAGEVTKEKRAKTMSTSHLKECIMNVSMFDFLKDIVAEVPDMQNEEEPGTSGISVPPEAKKLSKKRSAPSSNAGKKRAKHHARSLTEDSETNEDVEDLDVEDDHNGAPSAVSAPIPNNLVPSAPKTTLSDARGSFHISLDALMSNNPASRGSHPVEVVLPPATEKKSKTADPIANYPATQKSDSVNGVVGSPQKPMDLTMNSSQSREAAKQQVPKISLDARKAQPDKFSGSQPGTAPNIPTPLNMSHVYNPPAPAPNITASLTKDLNDKIPQGGMLSFLYSGMPGEPGAAVTPSVKAPAANPTYPYNPVTEHYKKMVPKPGAPYASSLSASGMAPPVGAMQSQEDDDYDN